VAIGINEIIGVKAENQRSAAESVAHQRLIWRHQSEISKWPVTCGVGGSGCNIIVNGGNNQ
jgi:hypothetical protein